MSPVLFFALFLPQGELACLLFLAPGAGTQTTLLFALFLLKLERLLRLGAGAGIRKLSPDDALHPLRTDCSVRRHTRFNSWTEP